MNKVLISVKSCHRDRYMHPRILETWGSLVQYYDWIDLRFFIGRPAPPYLTSNEVPVACADDYASLTSKVDAVLNWFLTVPEYTHIFICDTDTYVDVAKLATAFTGHEQYVGFTGMNAIHGAAHGGPGYWLSRQAVEVVIRLATRDSIQSTAQDEWWVYEQLYKVGIHPVHDERYSLLTPPGSSHSCITYHDSRVRTDSLLLHHWFEDSTPIGDIPLIPHPLDFPSD